MPVRRRFSVVGHGLLEKGKMAIEHIDNVLFSSNGRPLKGDNRLKVEPFDGLQA